MKTDNQCGIAHFLEHIAFSRSKNFLWKNMIEEMQKIGILFGKGLNASTSFFHKIFTIEIPNTDEDKISKCLTVMNHFENKRPQRCGS
jgi:zinc protease